ncbi:MAG: family 16 glycoside hydrolase, partial [Planctomycetaceae bacterium]
MLYRTLFLMALLALGTRALEGADDPQKGYTTPEAAAADPDFALQGEYVGPEVGVQVVALGQGKFQVVTYRGGLPGAGWNGALKQSAEEDRDELKKTIADLQLKKTERKSPTLGVKPPEGAVVLFDGTPESLSKHWRDGARLSTDKLLEQGVTSLDTFQDFSIHIEFRMPYMPLARGQGRGNSGLYYQGRYETQMLDSFGLEGKDNECGGIYSIKDPDVNMCLPPLAWQTYDAVFTAARFDKDGKKIANARVTVRHNGVLIHEDVELPRITTAAPNQEGAEAGPIYLQDHGNPVRYRNIWVLPRDAQKEARRPVVPAFERFHASAVGENVAGGRLLLTELNCTVCHAAPEALANSLIRRPGPVLDQIGERTRPEWLLAYLADPHGVKPGTAMPDLLRGLPEAERAPAAKALAHLLASTGTLAEKSSDAQAIGRGKTLFHQIGCVACHAPREGASVPTQSSIPLGDLSAKYSISSLATFLENPHVARPSGRMP